MIIILQKTPRNSGLQKIFHKSNIYIYLIYIYLSISLSLSLSLSIYIYIYIYTLKRITTVYDYNNIKLF